MCMVCDLRCKGGYVTPRKNMDTPENMELGSRLTF